MNRQRDSRGRFGGCSDSLMQRVADLLTKLGRATVDDLLLGLEGYTRAQVVKALSHAVQNRLVVCEGIRNVKGRSGALPSYYRPRCAEEEVAAKVKGGAVFVPPASVWALAQSRELVPMWPPAWEGGREYLLLGPEEEEAEAEVA